MSIYKECDIRGIYKQELDEATAYDIGRAIGSMIREKTLAVGGDVRISTPVLKDRLVKGLLDSGTDVTDLGMVPTPAFYYALAHLPVFGGVTVTASHNPAKYNGFKLMFGNMPTNPAEINEIEQRVNKRAFSSGAGKQAKFDVIPEYKKSLEDRFKQGKLKVVIDAGNGTMSSLAPEVFEELGYAVVRLYCESDGSFPNRDPNPAVYENLKALCKAVVDNNADLGIAFDGDGDRVVFVDNKGDVVKSEQSLVIFIGEYLKNGSSSVVYDLKSSSIVKDKILEMGGVPLIERSGHAFIKRRFLDNDSVLAGEISGHFFFRELGYDDGLYAALAMAEIIGKSGKTLADLTGIIPRTLITPDIRIFCPYPERDSWLDSVRTLGTRYEISEIDGVRVEFPKGWLLVRKSVTEEGMTVRIEAKDSDALSEIKAILLGVLPQLKSHEFFS